MIIVNALAKRFGNMVALQDENISLNNGEILGLIGKNGSGKTTTFRLLLNFLKPDSGNIQINGRSIDKLDYSTIGYLPEEHGLYQRFTVKEQIIYFATLKGMKKHQILSIMQDWLDKFEVKATLNSRISSLSKGNQQKVQLITTLMHQPKIILLDEPFSGLDPINAQLLQKEIIRQKENGASIIFSSHDMANVENISDKILMLKNGTTALNGYTQDVRSSFGYLRVNLVAKIPMAKIRTIPGVLDAKTINGAISLRVQDDKVAEVVYQNVRKETKITEFSQSYPSLDEIFKLKGGD